MSFNTSKDPTGYNIHDDMVASKKWHLGNVVKLNKKGLFLVITAVTVTLGATFISMAIRTEKNDSLINQSKDGNSEVSKEIKAASPSKTLTEIGATSDDAVAKIQAIRDSNKAKEMAKSAGMTQAPAPLPNNLPAPSKIAIAHQDASPVAASAKRQKEEEDKRREEELIMKAMLSDSEIDFGNSPISPVNNTTTSRDKLYDAALQKMSSQGIAGSATGNQQKTDTDKKNEFVEKADLNKDEVLFERKRPVITRYQVMAGSFIPAILETPINSDLPGMVTARITETVYDTVTGRYVIIPQGSKVVGRYDAETVYGQERVLLVWDRIIFPDGSSIAIHGMQGADQLGQSGFADGVDRHFWRAFQSAFLMSMLSAAVQQSQPQQAGTTQSNLNAGQSVGQEMGRMFGQLGMEIVRKGLNIKPTITVRAGYQFNIMVNKDMIFDEPYKETGN